MKKLFCLFIGVALAVAYGLIGSMDRADQEAERAQYCEMVELWQETNGDAGWPPYNGECE